MKNRKKMKTEIEKLKTVLDIMLLDHSDDIDLSSLVGGKNDLYNQYSLSQDNSKETGKDENINKAD